MASLSTRQYNTAHQILKQIEEFCVLTVKWNEDINCGDDYGTSPEGLKTLAATSMHLESIGEAIKKIDKLLPGFLNEKEPLIPWKNIKGLRDHIAHGYFDIDAEIIFDVVSTEINPLIEAIRRLIKLTEDSTEK